MATGCQCFNVEQLCATQGLRQDAGAWLMYSCKGPKIGGDGCRRV